VTSEPAPTPGEPAAADAPTTQAIDPSADTIEMIEAVEAPQPTGIAKPYVPKEADAPPIVLTPEVRAAEAEAEAHIEAVHRARRAPTIRARAGEISSPVAASPPVAAPPVESVDLGDDDLAFLQQAKPKRRGLVVIALVVVVAAAAGAIIFGGGSKQSAPTPTATPQPTAPATTPAEVTPKPPVPEATAAAPAPAAEPSAPDTKTPEPTPPETPPTAAAPMTKPVATAKPQKTTTKPAATAKPAGTTKRSAGKGVIVRDTPF
jgi:hypothetical protein